MQCIPILLVCVSIRLKISSETKITFGYLSPRHYIYVSKDMRIRGYFSKPKGVREPKKVTVTSGCNSRVLFCIQLIFQSGFNQTCTYGNIALDDIEVFYTPCESTGTTQYQPHTPLTTSTTKTAEDTTRSPCVTDMPLPTATKDPNPLPISQTKNPSITAKPPIHDFTIFPPDFLKPSSTAA